MRLRDTPIEVYNIRGFPIHVKREDLCWPFPPLSKARGVWRAMESRPGVNVAVVDTGRSLNGQLVATIGLTLGRRVKCGYPVYKATPNEIPGPIHALRSLSGSEHLELVPLRANRQFNMRHEMAQRIPEDWFLFPTGLRLPETVDAVEEVVLGLPLAPGSFVVPTGTGTHLAGVLRAFPGPVLAIQGYSREERLFRRDVQRMAGGVPCNGRVRIVDPKRDYFEVRPGLMPPFPAHLHYECPAWAFLHIPGVLETLPPPIVFWNVGA